MRDRVVLAIPLCFSALLGMAGCRDNPGIIYQDGTGVMQLGSGSASSASRTTAGILTESSENPARTNPSAGAVNTTFPTTQGTNPSSSVGTGSTTGAPTTQGPTTEGPTTQGPTSGGPTTSDSGSTSESPGNTEPFPVEGIEVALDIRADLSGNPLVIERPRVLIASLELGMNPANDQSMGLDFSVKKRWIDEGLSPDPAGNYRLTIPAPDPATIDPALERGPLLMVALYNDADANMRWTPSDGFVAAAPSVLYYEANPQTRKGRWMSATDLGFRALLVEHPATKYPTGRLRRAPLLNTLRLRRLDPKRPGLRYGGSLVNLGVIDDNIAFVASVGVKEINDLSQGFVPGPRPVDVALRQDPNASTWSIQGGELSELGPALDAQAMPLKIPPGLSLQSLAAWPLAGYMRPIGEPLAEPGQFLSKSSTLWARVCVPGQYGKAYAAVVRMRENAATAEAGPVPWISDPVGALYAAVLGIGPGLNLGLYAMKFGSIGELYPRSNQDFGALRINRPVCGAMVPLQ